MTDHKNRLSASGLQRLLGLGSYRTAWLWLQKLQRAMVRPGLDQLEGRVEVDETYIDAVETTEGSRHVGNKALVAIAAQVDRKGIGRIRLRRIPAASATPLIAFVKQAVQSGSVVITDGWEAYAGLTQEGFNHRPRVINPGNMTASGLLPRVQRVASLLKRWLLRTHQGMLSGERLDSYLDEFTFLFNRRTSKYRGKLFHRLLTQVITVEPSSFPRLVTTS
jgi:transposase-like protein